MSIIIAHLTHLPIGVFIALINIPFVFLGYKKFGKTFAVLSTIGIITLATLTSFHTPQGLTDVPILGAIFGGIIVGVGIGIVVRYGGVLDGTDAIALLIDRLTVFSVGEAILVINSFIIACGGFVFGWNAALYSMVAYLIAHKAIDITVEGLNESRSLWIVSMHVREIGKAINELVEEPVTFIKESDPKAREPHGILLAVITRFEEEKVRAATLEVDKHAYIVISKAHEVMGRLSEDTLHRDITRRSSS